MDVHTDIPVVIGKKMTMNTAIVLGTALTLGCCSGLAQTNGVSRLAGMFSVPQLQLRQETSTAEYSLETAVVLELNPTARASRTNTADATESPSGQTLFNEFEFDSLSGVGAKWAGLLILPEPESEYRLVRFMDRTFEPDVIRVGKVQISCSLVTAIKRKNPLCLINPCFLGIGW